MKYDIDADAAALLKAGHEETQKTDCDDNYSSPSYKDKVKNKRYEIFERT